jgi:hypothetical protein
LARRIRAGARGPRELARQPFRFLTRLLVAAGCEGWVLLFDDIELIGRYTL